jgi:hypothetical protein
MIFANFFYACYTLQILFFERNDIYLVYFCTYGKMPIKSFRKTQLLLESFFLSFFAKKNKETFIKITTEIRNVSPKGKLILKLNINSTHTQAKHGSL